MGKRVVFVLFLGSCCFGSSDSSSGSSASNDNSGCSPAPCQRVDEGASCTPGTFGCYDEGCTCGARGIVLCEHPQDLSVPVDLHPLHDLSTPDDGGGFD